MKFSKKVSTRREQSITQRSKRMWSLKKMIPSLAQQQTVDAVDILDEATNHIHRLEEKLL